MTSSAKKVTIKEEGASSRIKVLEEDTKALQNDVKKFLSIVTLQTEQLARQEKIIAGLRDERNAKAANRLLFFWVLLFVVAFLLTNAARIGFPSEDTVLYLNTKATPVKAPFITAAVKVRFTLGDAVACAKGAFAGDTLDLSLA